MTPAAAYRPTIDLIPVGPGRVFEARRTVRLGDVDPGGLVRLDALARYAQDVASDDVRDVGLAGKWGWVVRRTAMVVVHRPGFEHQVTLATWCAGTGAAWAERRTTVFAGDRPVAEITGLWVCLDPATRRPAALEPAFLEIYGPTAVERRVPSRLVHPGPPPGISGRPWPLRHSDFDAFGHVNNAALWAAVEDELARRRRADYGSIAASLEHRDAVEPGARLRLTAADDGDGGLGLWLLDDDGAVRASAMIGEPAS